MLDFLFSLCSNKTPNAAAAAAVVEALGYEKKVSSYHEVKLNSTKPILNVHINRLGAETIQAWYFFSYLTTQMTMTVPFGSDDIPVYGKLTAERR